MIARCAFARTLTGSAYTASLAMIRWRAAIMLSICWGSHSGDPHTVGRPAPGHEIRLIDDIGNEVERGQIDEILGHAPFMMSGYYGRAEAHEAVR
jgi:acyl-CoA synthetase (AMP-forming)/AMP-acid ligase II